MKTIYYDCFAGISGDMNLGAMIDLGVDARALERELRKLNLDGWRLEVSKDSRSGIFGTKVEVALDGEHATASTTHSHSDVCAELHSHAHNHDHTHEHECGCGHSRAHSHAHGHTHEHRAYSDIVKIIEASDISARAKKYALEIFEKIAAAEAKIHGKDMAEVCFHEVGALDSIIDIVGAGICADMLGAEKFACSEIELGGGTVKCAHGVIPVPAPATAEILKNAPVKINGAYHECTTPTGAAIVAALCGNFARPVKGRILANGIGVGHRISAELPNVLRVSLIDETDNADNSDLLREKMFVLETNIDDMTAEELSFLCGRLFAAGAADVWQESISMKKSRLAAKVCALVSAEKRAAATECLLKNSSTLGVRISEVDRVFLPRESVKFASSLGEVNFKISEFRGVKKSKPEFEDCKKIAEENGLSIREATGKLEDEFRHRQA